MQITVQTESFEKPTFTIFFFSTFCKAHLLVFFQVLWTVYEAVL